jgi:cobyrinic acid a,c-diamide synthase
VEDSSWYLKQRSDLQEALWYLQQQSRHLQDYRLDIRGIWADDAATEIDRRYLNIHTQDSSESARSLGSQLASIVDADVEFDLANRAGMKATQLSQQIDRLLQLARADINRSRAEYYIYQERDLAANNAIYEIQSLIAQAGEYP